MRVLAVSDEVDLGLGTTSTSSERSTSSWHAGTCRSTTWPTMDGLDVPLVFVAGNHDPASPGTDRPGAGCSCAPGSRPSRRGRAAPSTPTAPWSTSPGCASPASVAGCATATGPTSTPSASSAAGPDGWPRPPAGAGSGTARGRRRADPCPPRGVGDGDDEPTMGSVPGTGVPGSSRPCSCTVTSTGTAPDHRLGRRSCATSSAATSRRSTEDRRTGVPRDTGFPRADVENDFLRARGARSWPSLSQLAEPRTRRRQHHACPSTRSWRRSATRASDRSACRRSSSTRSSAASTRSRVRPAVPADLGPGPRALGAARAGAASGRVDAADRRLQGR